jgi:hypothetical protein
MRRVIKQRIRRKSEGVDLAMDVNADVVVNVGGSKAATQRHDRRTAQAGEPVRREADEPASDDRQDDDPKGRER